MIVTVTEGLHLTYVTIEDDWVKTDLGVFNNVGKHVAYAFAEWIKAQPDLSDVMDYLRRWDEYSYPPDIWMRIVNRRVHEAQIINGHGMVVFMKCLSAAE